MYVGETHLSNVLKNKSCYSSIILTQWIILTVVDFREIVNEEFPDIHNHSDQGVISGRQLWNVAVFGEVETKHGSPVPSHFEEQTNHHGKLPAPGYPKLHPSRRSRRRDL